ncbi:MULTISPECIES: hypothetical protein [Bacillus cereus group]|uniref:hypothetical protein n=1 Tax=Bacillus cereus group TaxID=86661 RepID=UPI00030F5741
MESNNLLIFDVWILLPAKGCGIGVKKLKKEKKMPEDIQTGQIDIRNQSVQN